MKKDIFFALLSTILLIFSFPNFNLWLFAWFGFIPLLITLENKTPKQAFLLSYLSGILFFSGILYWLIHVTLPGLIVLVLYLSLYFGIFGLSVCLVAGRWSLVTIPAAWVLLEYLRSHLFAGFGWALLGYSQYLNLPIIQIADITGVWGVSFLVVMVNVTIYELAKNFRLPFTVYRLQKNGSRFMVHGSRNLIIFFISLIFVLGYGFFKLNQKLTGTTIRISVIQGNIPQEEKWEPQLKKAILEKYIRITRFALRDKPDMIIWPETALPGYLDEPELNERIVTLIKDIKLPLLIGSAIESEGKDYNSAILFSREGRVIGHYYKLHLVPFGEYVPRPFSFLRKFVEIGDFTPGKDYTIFSLPSDLTPNTPGLPNSSIAKAGKHQTPKFGVLICFEDTFPDLVRRFVKRDAILIVNITNDAWFKKTSSPYQHLQASVFRAVENRVNLIRCANTGFSGFIDPFGKIIGRVSDDKGEEIFVAGYKTEDIILVKRSTFYTRFGDLFVLFCIFALILYPAIIRVNPVRNTKI